VRVAGQLTDWAEKPKDQRLQLEVCRFMRLGRGGRLLCGGEVSDVHVLSKLKEKQNWREKLCLFDVECKGRRLIVRRMVVGFINQDTFSVRYNGSGNTKC